MFVFNHSSGRVQVFDLQAEPLAGFDLGGRLKHPLDMVFDAGMLEIANT